MYLTCTIMMLYSKIKQGVRTDLFVNEFTYMFLITTLISRILKLVHKKKAAKTSVCNIGPYQRPLTAACN
jgi:hypothetical protein